jgi:hypothetical protein
MLTFPEPTGKTPMLPEFLLPETTIREAGTGPVLDLSEQAGRTLVLTLGLTRIIEQESIDVSIWGSADSADWGAKPLASFPQKFYCGTYQIVLELSGCPSVKYLRAKWQANRWGRGEPKPLFCAYLFAQEMARQTMAVGG